MEDKKNNDNPTMMEKTEGWWSGLVGEFKRITWPSRPQLAKMTIAAIITSGVVGAIIVGYDFGLDFLYNALAGVFS